MDCEHIIDYVTKAYPKRFKNVVPIVEDCDSHYKVYHNIDASPLILSKHLDD